MSDMADQFGLPVVELPAATASPEAAVTFLVGELVRLGRLRPELAAHVTREVLRRESLGSTHVGSGVVVPHSFFSGAVDEVTGVVGRAATPMAWHGDFAHVVCLLVTPAGPGASLQALEAVARQLRGG